MKELAMIYCVEDDRGIRELMTYTLNVSGFKAKGLKDSEELFSALKEEIPELITLAIFIRKHDIKCYKFWYFFF